jgi:hypothetical protein
MVPGLTRHLYDLPRVVATAPSLLREHNVADRVHIAEGSFFDSVPAGGDASDDDVGIVDVVEDVE